MPRETTRIMRRAVRLLRQQGRFGNLTHAQLDRCTADLMAGIETLERHLGIGDHPPPAEIVQLRGRLARLEPTQGDAA